jgi:hypothetical protein
MVSRRPEELRPGGDRASVVAKKRGNARGVKGGWKVETLNQESRGAGRVRLRPKRGFPLCLDLQRHPHQILARNNSCCPTKSVALFRVAQSKAYT